MAWTFSDNYDLLPNLYIRSNFNDGVLSFYEIFPVEGYVLWIPSLDAYEYDDENNLILDENGNPVLRYHYYTWGGATQLPSYDWATNPNEYQAVPYEEGMTVFGTVEPPHEIM